MNRLKFIIIALVLAGIACNLPAQGTPSPTPNVVFVTETPDTFAGEAIPPETPQVGPFQATRPPATVEPTLNLDELTVVLPGGVTAAPGQSTLVPDGATVPPHTATPAGATQVAENTPQPTTAPDEPTATPGLTQTPAPTGTAEPTATNQPTATPRPTSEPPSPPVNTQYASRMGLNFVSSAQHETDVDRFVKGIESGAGWDRFAIYWYDIEFSPGAYDWSVYDETIRNDVRAGLQTNAILLGVPAFYAAENNVPQGLYEPVFTDGTDIPGPGKTVNPDNPWAVWVSSAVLRYRPRGILSETEGWSAGEGVTVWEIWNEPDFSKFWQGTVQDYARLLKVSYAAIKHMDSDAQVMVGGLVLFEQPAFLIDMLNIYQDDPNPVPGRYPFDLLAIHSYSHPPFSFYVIQRTESLLALYGLEDVPIWLNESGVALWDDYPGPTWATRPDQRVWRATQEEQAAYILQNAAMSFMAEVAVYFHFQLFDDCGNQPRGTDFAPHNGELCEGGAACWGDALGLVRNTADNVCFSQHPNPGSERPAYEAYRYAAQLFGSGDLTPLEMFNVGQQRWLIFAHQERGELVYFLWNEGGSPTTASVRARADQALLVRADGTSQTLDANDDDLFTVDLAPATNQNGTPGSAFDYMIGGEPVVLIQRTDDPYVSVLPLPANSRRAFLVKWRANRTDLSGFEIYYRDDTAAGEWQLWLEADDPGEALFVGESGRTYSFFARAKTPDDAWSLEEPEVQAQTRAE